MASFFLLGFALVGSYLVVTSLADTKPKYFGNADYWMTRVRACESGNGVWGNANYEQAGGAFGYKTAKWDNYSGTKDANEASSNAQNDKFAADWNNPEIGSKPWKDTMDCWKPSGTIKGAPCLPVPKNPVIEEISTDSNPANDSEEAVDTDSNAQEDASSIENDEASNSIPVIIPENIKKTGNQNVPEN